MDKWRWRVSRRFMFIAIIIQLDEESFAQIMHSLCFCNQDDVAPNLLPQFTLSTLRLKGSLSN